MQISPVYDTEPVLSIEGLGNPSAAVRRQRERLRDVLRGLTAEQWAAPSRCERWSVKDVVSHLAGTDAFWALTVAAAMRGEPTRLLTGFDPVATPELMVEAMRGLSPDEVLAQFEANATTLNDTLESVEDWSVLGEAPPGHLALNVTALHALWDAWVHERDIVIPLGLTPAEEPDELVLVLQYAAALSPALSASQGRARRGALAVEAAAPEFAFTVEVTERVVVRPGATGGGTRLAGPAAELIDGLSRRRPLPAGLAIEDAWLVTGLAEIFDQL